MKIAALFLSLFMLLAAPCQSADTPTPPEEFKMHGFLDMPWGTSREDVLAQGFELNEDGKAVVQNETSAIILEFRHGKLIRGVLILQIPKNKEEALMACAAYTANFAEKHSKPSSVSIEKEYGTVFHWINKDTTAHSICRVGLQYFALLIEKRGAPPEHDTYPAKPPEGTLSL